MQVNEEQLKVNYPFKPGFTQDLFSHYTVNWGIVLLSTVTFSLHSCFLKHN